MILPVKCPRLHTGCCAIKPGDKVEYHNKCERMEEYVYCEYYSNNLMIQKESSSIVKIVQTVRKR